MKNKELLSKLKLDKFSLEPAILVLFIYAMPSYTAFL